MKLRFAAIGIVFLLLACADGGNRFLAPPTTDGTAWLVVYRSGLGIGEADIIVDGTVRCALPSGSVFVRPLQAGRHTITGDTPYSPGLSVLKFDARPGQTTYIKVAVNRGRIARGFIPIYGWVNSFVEAEQNRGKPGGNLFSLDQVSEAAARDDMDGDVDTVCGSGVASQ